jgi:hypothetical protein
MQVLIKSGYLNELLLQLNQVCIWLQVLFMSDILTASGNKTNSKTLSCCPCGGARSSMQWPNEQPTESNFKLWRYAMQSICPSRSRAASIGRFIASTHKIWRWAWNDSKSTLHQLSTNSATEDVLISGKKPNRFHYSHYQPRGNCNMICLVEPTLVGEHYRLTSIEPVATLNSALALFLDVLHSWGNTWLWEDLSVTGRMTWIEESIANSTLVAVTDGSYTRELFPNLCSAAFVLECSKGHGRIIGALLEAIRMANAYRGELLGLMAIHLIILSINKMNSNLSRSVEIVSDCLGALKRKTYHPPYRIPSRCRCSDILKTILVHCRGLSFPMYYSHIKAHQDKNESFSKYSRKAHLNFICNHAAKQRIAADGIEGAKSGGTFPLEPIGLFVHGEKMTSDRGEQICFLVTLSACITFFNDCKILLHTQFESVD